MKTVHSMKKYIRRLDRMKTFYQCAGVVKVRTLALRGAAVPVAGTNQQGRRHVHAIDSTFILRHIQKPHLPS